MSDAVFLEVGEEIQESKPAVARTEEASIAGAASINFPMFVDCLVEPAGWQRRQRKWTATLSLTVQLLALGIAILIPLMFTDVLPTQQLVTFLVAPPPPPPPPPPVVAQAAVKPIATEIVSGRLVAPTKIPDKIRMIKEDAAPPPGFGVPGGVVGGIAGGQLGGVLGGIINSSVIHSVVVAPPAVSVKRLRISEGVSTGRLIDKVQPEYPLIAKSSRIQGVVQLDAWITKEGAIERLTVVSGHPLLTKAALDAVKKWRYKPFLLNGDPIEVETTINVIFSLSGGGA